MGRKPSRLVPTQWFSICHVILINVWHGPMPLTEVFTTKETAARHSGMLSKVRVFHLSLKSCKHIRYGTFRSFESQKLRQRRPQQWMLSLRTLWGGCICNSFILPIKLKSLGNTRKRYKNGSDPTVVSLLSS